METETSQTLFSDLAARTPTGEALELVLYKSDTCFFCHRVLQAAQSLKIPLTLKDTRREPAAYDKLVEVGGKAQVPCLFINGEPLYESSDIIEFFSSKVVVTPKS